MLEIVQKKDTSPSSGFIEKRGPKAFLSGILFFFFFYIYYFFSLYADKCYFATLYEFSLAIGNCIH